MYWPSDRIEPRTTSWSPIDIKRDGVVVLAAFPRALAAAGLPGGAGRTRAFLSAVGVLSAGSRDDVYWAGRATLTASIDDLDIYDAVFDAYFDADAPALRRAPSRRLPTDQMLLPDNDFRAPEAGPAEDETSPLRTTAAATEILRHADIAKLGADEKAELASMLALLRPGLPRRRSARWAPSSTGRVDARRTVRTMLAAGGEPGRLVLRRHRTRPRRLVLLIDVSGSMAPYSDALLRFAHVLVRFQRAKSRVAPEVFTMGTRLSRISRDLEAVDPDEALQAAADDIPDRSGGTRLGEVLQQFLARFGRRGIARGSVLVIFSDGWERGSTAPLADAVRQLGRLARRVVWVNPHKGKVGYEPVQNGILAVLPAVDHFVAGHSLAALEELLEVIRDA